MQDKEDKELVEVVIVSSRYDLQSSSPVEMPFAGKYLGNQGAYKAAQILVRNNAIKRVDLSNNSISDFGLLGFFKLLGNKAIASVFNFSRNCISDISIKSVLSFLNTNRRVVSFDLSKNKLTDLKALEVGLVNNYSIMHLGIESEELNRILLRNITHTKAVIAVCITYQAGTALKLSRDLVRSINEFGVEGARVELSSNVNFSEAELNNTLRQIQSLCQDRRCSKGISISAPISARPDKREYERIE